MSVDRETLSPKELDAVIASLTKAQREFLCSLPTYAVSTYPPARWLVAKGLAEWNGHRFVATKKGELVRARLSSKEPDNG